MRYLVIPNFRPTLYAAEEYGVGVSNDQGEIDWMRVRSDEVSFAYIKATEGERLVDPQLAANVGGAVAAELSTGLYHSFTLCSSGADQASNLLGTLADLPVEVEELTLPVAVDLELRGNCSSWPAPEVLEAELQEFFDAVAPVTGDAFVLYVTDPFDDRYEPASRFDHPYWRSSMFRRPADPFVVWRVSGRARVDGIEGDVDLNVARSSLAHNR